MPVYHIHAVLDDDKQTPTSEIGFIGSVGDWVCKLLQMEDSTTYDIRIVVAPRTPSVSTELD